MSRRLLLSQEHGWGFVPHRLPTQSGSWVNSWARPISRGFGFTCEYDVERKFRETRLYQVAPISTNLILSYIAEHVLGLPRSF